MNFNKELKIKQIISAQRGWKAVHCAQSENGQLAMFERAIVCWALVEQHGGRKEAKRKCAGWSSDSTILSLSVILSRLEFIDADELDCNEYFFGYDDPDAHRESQYWIGEAYRRLRQRKGTKSEIESLSEKWNPR